MSDNGSSVVKDDELVVTPKTVQSRIGPGFILTSGAAWLSNRGREMIF